MVDLIIIISNFLKKIKAMIKFTYLQITGLYDTYFSSGEQGNI